MNCHINPKYVNEALNGGSRLTLTACMDRDKGEDHAFFSYSIGSDRMMYLAKDGRVWLLPKHSIPVDDIVTVGHLKYIGSELLPDLWMVRNEEPSPFCFERK